MSKRVTHGTEFVLLDPLAVQQLEWAIVAALPDALLVLDEQRRRVVATNQRFLKMANLTADALKQPGFSPLDLFHPQSHTAFLAIGEVGMDPSQENGPVRLRLKDGQDTAVESAGALVLLPGSPPRWLYFFRPDSSNRDTVMHDRQKRLANEAVQTFHSIYHFTQRIRCAPKLASLLLGATDEESMCACAAEFLTAGGFQCQEVTIVLSHADGLRLAHSTSVDGPQRHAEKLQRYARYLETGEQPRQPEVRLYRLTEKDRAIGLLEVRLDRRDCQLIESNPELAAWQDDILRTVAEIIALRLSNLRLQVNLTSLTISDPLTGVYNRRYLLTQMEAEVRRAQRFQRPLSTIFIDLDDFKTINDTYGHAQGDSVLRTVAGILLSCVRESDYVCRYGGDEFVMILPETDIEAALNLAERLRQLISETSFERIPDQAPASNTDPSAPLKLTVSSGVASTDVGDDLLKAADAALYSAKRQGRNRTTLAADKVPAPK
ncbi:MAG: diguanylate cyclase [Planctomycetota bacterium]